MICVMFLLSSYYQPSDVVDTWVALVWVVLVPTLCVSCDSSRLYRRVYGYKTWLTALCHGLCVSALKQAFFLQCTLTHLCTRTNHACYYLSTSIVLNFNFFASWLNYRNFRRVSRRARMCTIVANSSLWAQGVGMCYLIRIIDSM